MRDQLDVSLLRSSDFFSFSGSKVSDTHSDNQECACPKHQVNYRLDVSQIFVRRTLGPGILHRGVLNIDRRIRIALDVAYFERAFLTFGDARHLVDEMVEPFDYADRAVCLCGNCAARWRDVERSAPQRLLNIDFHSFDWVICFYQVVEFFPFNLCVQTRSVEAEVEIRIRQQKTYFIVFAFIDSSIKLAKMLALVREAAGIADN